MIEGWNPKRALVTNLVCAALPLLVLIAVCDLMPERTPPKDSSQE